MTGSPGGSPSSPYLPPERPRGCGHGPPPRGDGQADDDGLAGDAAQLGERSVDVVDVLEDVKCDDRVGGAVGEGETLAQVGDDRPG